MIKSLFFGMISINKEDHEGKSFASFYPEEKKNPLWAVYRLGNKKNDSVQEWERPWTFYSKQKSEMRFHQNDTENKQVHSVYVITGPIFKKNPPGRLESGVAIPDEFYKIIAFKKGYFGTLKAVSLIFPQEPETEFMDYVAAIDQIDLLTGVWNFFRR